MNEESLRRANAFLAAVAARVQPGEVLKATPADIGRAVGLPEPLSAARAVRALLARRRLEVVDGNYRLLDPRPVEPGERESIPRKPRKRSKAPARSRAGREVGSTPSRPTYSEVGREAIERLIELGREAGTLRGHLRQARDEARDAREAKVEAEHRTRELAERCHELEARLEMAERNLRTLLSAAKGTVREASVGDADMEAILGVLKVEREGEVTRPEPPAETEPQAETQPEAPPQLQPHPEPQPERARN